MSGTDDYFRQKRVREAQRNGRLAAALAEIELLKAEVDTQLLANEAERERFAKAHRHDQRMITLYQSVAWRYASMLRRRGVKVPTPDEVIAGNPEPDADHFASVGKMVPE